MPRKKEVRNENEFIDSVINAIEEVDTLKELEQKIGEELTPEVLSKIRHRFITLRKQTLSLARTYSTRGDLDLSIEQKENLKNLKDLFEKFKDMKKNENNNQKQEKKLSSKKTVSKIESRKQKIISEIESINHWISLESKQQFAEYQQKSMYGDRLDILKRLTTLYIEYMEKLKVYQKETMEEIMGIVIANTKIEGNRATTKKLVYDTLNTEAYKPFQEKIQSLIEKNRKTKRIIENLKRLQNIEKEIIKPYMYPELTNEDLIEKRKYISPKNDIEKQYQQLLKGIISRRYVKQYKDKLKQGLPEEINEMLESFQNLPPYELESLIALATDIIKNKRNRIKKGFSETGDLERDFLKKLTDELKKMRPIYYEDDEDTRVYYDILDVLMQDDRNYNYIKELLEIDEFRRARQVYKTRGGRQKNTKKEHILLLVLDNFIKNYKLKLVNQNIEYIEPSYYKEIIKLFIEKQPNLYPEELEEYSQRIEEFRDYIKNKKYHTTTNVLNDIDEISNFHPEIQSTPKEEKENQKLNQNRKKVYQECLKYGVLKNRKNGVIEYYPTETTKTFQIQGTTPYAFSLRYLQDGRQMIGVHILDTSKITQELDFLNQELQQGKVKLPTFNQEQTYPTISIQGIIGYNNEITDEKIMSSNIKIDTYYTKEDLEHYKMIPELKEMRNWLYIIQNKLDITENGIKNIVNNYLSEVISENFQTEGIPFIYKTSLPQMDKLIVKNHNDTCVLLSKMPKKTAHQIYDILDSQQAGVYYTPENINDAKIDLRPDTELGVYLLTTLNKINAGRYNPDIAQEEIKNLLTKYNDQSEYLPPIITEKNDKKVNQMVKKYQKVAQG